MIVSDLRTVENDKHTRMEATVTWEIADQSKKKVYIETENAFAADLASHPHAFLVGCFIPAMHLGEKRLVIEGDICPVLFEGLQTAMAILSHWSGGSLQPLSIEAGTLAAVRYPERSRRAALFMSGGIDSLAALKLNRERYPETHPGYIKDCLLVHGFDIGGVVERGMKYHVFERAKQAMAKIAADTGVTLIPVYTNIRHLCDDRDLWLTRFFGAVLAAVAHSFDARTHLAYIGSSYDLPNLAPCGSHPLLDPEYSSYDLMIRHRDLEVSRIDKIRAIADWEIGLNNLRVCLANVKDRLNCGKCEKCVRTMLGLEAVGVLEKITSFEEKAVTPELLDAFSITIRHREHFYEELLEPLKTCGRPDLVAKIEEKLATP
jgi:hypothetical protein